MPNQFDPIGQKLIGITAASGTQTIDLSAADIQDLTFSTQAAATATLAVSNDTAGQLFRVRIVNSNSGTLTLTMFSGITWYTTSPTLAVTTGKKSEYLFKVDTAGSGYTGYVIADLV